MKHAFDVDDATLSTRFPERNGLKGIAQLQFDIERIFIDITPGMLRDLEEEVAREAADVVIGDNACAAPALLAERTGIPWAVFGITVLAMSSRDTAPFGLSLFPSSTPLGRLRNRALQKLVDSFVFRSANARYAQMRETLGFPKDGTTLFNVAQKASLYLQSGVAEFEYPRTDLPPQLRFIGSTIPQAPASWTPPRWWNDLDGSKPVVLVTQGTIANDYNDLIVPAIRALAHERVQVIVTTGSRPPAEVPLETLPLNVHIEQFIPYAQLMPKVDLLVTNGGFGSIQIALANGVPVVAYGNTEEKPEIANRVQWSGVGRGIRRKTADPAELRATVMRVLNNSMYRQKARAIARKLSALDAPAEAANLLEQLLTRESEVAA